MASWPPLHYEAYRNAFGKLFAKALIQLSSDKQAFRLTNAGLAALGMAR
jgi:hypothetical protein